jgi:hypothetical protein
MMKRLRTYLLMVALLSLGATGYALIVPQSASALSGSDFNPARIVDDDVFFNKDTMGTTEIQTFLNSKVPTCDTNGTQMHSSGRTRAAHGTANGAPPPYICLKDYTQSFNSTNADAYCGAITGGTKSAANIIFDVAQACRINPQSLLVLLQKEQSLITDDWPWPIQYRSATGYGCPDTAACDSQYYGFFNQVYNAGRQFRRYTMLPNSFNYAVGRTSFILYNPNSGCGGTNVTPQTASTAALYNYTPYQPNQAALNNLYGSGDGCSAYGNRNFWRMFHDWFGPTTGSGFIRAKADNCSSGCPQYVIYGGLKQYIPSSQILNAWGLTDEKAPLISVDASYLASLPTGPNLDRLMRLNTSPGYLYFVDGGNKYLVTTNYQLEAFNLTGLNTSYVSTGLFNLPVGNGNMKFSVKHPSNSNIYMVDGISGGQTVLRQYASDAVYKAWEGETATYNTFSTDFFDSIDNAIGASLTHTKITHSGAEHQVVNGHRMSQPAAYSTLFPGTAQSVLSTTYNRLVPFSSVSYLVRSVSSPALYLIDGGVKRHILYPELITAWAYPGAGYHVLNDAYVDLIPTGDSISGYIADTGSQLYLMGGNKITIPTVLDDAYRLSSTVHTVSTELMSLYPTASSQASGFIKGFNTPQVYLLDNSGKRRHIEWSDKLELLGGNSPIITQVNDSLISNIATAASPNVFVTDGTDEYIIESGKKALVTPSIKADWGFTGAQLYSDGTLDRFESGGTLDNELRGNGGYFLIRGGIAYGTADLNIAKVWDLDTATVRNPKLISNYLRYFMLTRFVRSSTDNRVFAVSEGNWYNLSNAHLVNLGGVNAPKMILDPALAPNSITEWPSVVVKTSSNEFHLIDNGGKRTLPSGMIKDQWTNFGNIGAVTVDEGFLNMLPYRGTVERAVKGSAPQVYSADNGHKRHIRYPDTYNQYYAPYSIVSDVLLDAMPDGVSI